MLPKEVRPFLWSSDLRKVDLQRHRNRIILNVLNIGSRQATDWLFSFYSKQVIREVVINYGAKGELSPKSLNYWTLVLDITKNKLIKSRI